MTGPAVPFLRHELDAEMAARARAEAEADDLRDLAGVLRRRVEGLAAEVGALRRLLGSRLLQGAAPFAVAGLVGGFGVVLAIRWAGW